MIDKVECRFPNPRFVPRDNDLLLLDSSALRDGDPRMIRRCLARDRTYLVDSILTEWQEWVPRDGAKVDHKRKVGELIEAACPKQVIKMSKYGRGTTARLSERLSMYIGDEPVNVPIKGTNIEYEWGLLHRLEPALPKTVAYDTLMSGLTEVIPILRRIYHEFEMESLGEDNIRRVTDALIANDPRVADMLPYFKGAEAALRERVVETLEGISQLDGVSKVSEPEDINYSAEACRKHVVNLCSKLLHPIDEGKMIAQVRDYAERHLKKGVSTDAKLILAAYVTPLGDYNGPMPDCFNQVMIPTIITEEPEDLECGSRTTKLDYVTLTEDKRPLKAHIFTFDHDLWELLGLRKCIETEWE